MPPLSRGFSRPGWDARAAILIAILVFAAPAFAQTKLDLTPRLRKGDVHSFQITLDQEIEQAAIPIKWSTRAEAPSSGRQTRQTIRTGYTFQVDDVNERGATVSIRYDSVAFHAKTPAATVDYNSANPPGQVPPAASALAALAGHGYSIHIDSRGEVTRTSGADKLLNEILAKLTLPAGPVRTAFEKSLRQQLDEKNLKAGLNAVFAPWVDHPVAVGDIWTRNFPPEIGLPFTVQTRCRLERSDDDVCTVSVEGKVATISAAAIDMKPMTLSYDLAGAQRGKVQISTRTGWIASAEISQKLSGSATLRSPGNLPETVQLTISTTMKVEQK